MHIGLQGRYTSVRRSKWSFVLFSLQEGEHCGYDILGGVFVLLIFKQANIVDTIF